MAHCWLCLSHVACRPPSPSMSTKQQPSSSSMHTSTMLLIHSRFHFSFSQENTVFTLTLSRSPMTCSAVRATSLPEQALPTKIFPSTWSKVSAREHRSCGVNVEKHFFTQRTIGMSFFDAFQEARAFGPLSRKRCVQGSSAGGSTRFKEATLLFTMTDGQETRILHFAIAQTVAKTTNIIPSFPWKTNQERMNHDQTLASTSTTKIHVFVRRQRHHITSIPCG